MYKLKRALLYIPYKLILRPLITRNYRLRADGKIPDAWYWADKLGSSYGYFEDGMAQGVKL